MRSLIVSLMLCGAIAGAGVADEPAGAPDLPYGIANRVPWTTSNFRGRPEPPPPYRTERLFPKLTFEKPTVITTAPGTERLFVGEFDGKIYSIPRDREVTEADLLLDTSLLVDRLQQPGQPPIAFDALYGLTFDPDFVTNRYCYVCYVIKPRDRSLNQLPEGTRVSRFRVSETEPPRCDPDSEQLIISWLHGGHNGGCLKFGHDGCLYISTGDGSTPFPPDARKAGQDMTTLLSKILRIDVRRQENGRPYAIPADNPFVNLDKARGEIWAYGLRNPWRMSIDRQTGDLWVGDVGWELWELVYRVNKGDNFGWSIVEGSQLVHSEGQRGPTPIVPPTIEIAHTEGASVTGGFVYRGQKFPELVGTYIFGDWETRRIWGVPVDGPQLGPQRELMIDPIVRIVDFAEDHQGELYLLDYDDGSIHTLVRNPTSAQENHFPRQLSQTGLFRSVADHQVADGVLRFSINAEQWSDHASAERFLAVPESNAIGLRDRAKVVPGSQFSRMMDYPLDTVLVKTLSLEMTQGDPASRRRIETQALHFDGREWQGYTYEWNDEQTDATLVERVGKSRALHVADPQAPNGQRTQTWRFASRNECLRCHNPWSEYTLAFNVAQINRPHDYGGVCDNQIRALRHIGLLADVIEKPNPNDPLAKPSTPRSPEALAHLTDPFDATRDINDRARSYLHVNCGHCHRYNGGGSSYIYLQHDLSLLDTKAIGTRPTQGTFGIHDARILAPSDPYGSVLYFRLAKTGPGHMPAIGAKIVDEQALSLIHDWIRQLPVRLEDSAKINRLIAIEEATALAREQEEAPRRQRQLAMRTARQNKRQKPNEDDLQAAQEQDDKQAPKRAVQRAAERAKLTEELLATPPRAMLLVEALRQDRLPMAIRQPVLAAALLDKTDPAIRDLFEAFVPEENRTQRLGDSINPADILKLMGDLDRGRQLFHESTVVQCRSCHRIAGKGIELGPDLDAIGKKYDRAKLLESIMQPSLQIEPKYTPWLVETKSGLVQTGLLVEKNATEIILKDAQNKLQHIAADDVEGIYPQRKSLMPELLLGNFTAQQVADLLSYLGSLRENVDPTPPKPSGQ